MTVNPKDELYQDVSCIVVEPPNSGTAILDKLGFLIQEEGIQFNGLMSYIQRIPQRPLFAKGSIDFEAATVQDPETCFSM